MRSILLVLLFMPVLALANPSEQGLRAQLDEFLAGVSRGDASVHESFWAEDLVYTSSAGERFGKQAIVGDSGTEDAASDDQAEPEPASDVYSAEDIAIRVFGETAALTFTLLAKTPGGESKRYFNSGTFRYRDGRWQAIVWQATVAQP